MRYNLQMDGSGPIDLRSRFGLPGEHELGTVKMDTGKTDGQATLRFFSPSACGGADRSGVPGQIERCRQNAIPVTFNRYISRSGVDGFAVLEQVQRVREDGRFSGFILYETSNFMRFDKEGRCSNAWPSLEALKNFGGPK